MNINNLKLLILLAGIVLLQACGSDDDPGTDIDASTDYVLDPELFNSTNFVVSAQLVDCQLENGSNTKCYELTFISNGVPDDGPFCPATQDDIGGMGIYDGATNPGFQVMKKALFQAMEADGYDILILQGIFV